MKLLLTMVVPWLVALTPAKAQMVREDAMATGTDNPASAIARLYGELTAERDVVIEQGVAYGTHPRQRMDIYEPEPGSATRRRAIVMFYYGGSWTSGERAIYKFVGAALAKRGITTVIPDYRLFPEVRFPAFVGDAARAYAWVARNRAGGCGTRRPIYVMGHSAGAHIAALVALNPRHLADAGLDLPRPAGFIGMAGPYAFDPTTWATTKDIFAPAARMPDAARPLTFANARAPRTLLMHGTGDDVVEPYNSRDLFNALKTAGAAAHRIEYPGVGHVGLVLTLSSPFRWRADALQSIIDFIAAGRHGDCSAEGR
jgi:acetyl esterase/lipase